MNDALLYAANNKICKVAAISILERFSGLINWQNSKKVLDVGSAEGGVTLDVLLPKLPQNFQNLTGIDISENMVNFAKNRSKNLQNVNFDQMDISTQVIPKEYVEKFDQIFSFYCLQWVPEDKHFQPFKNMYDMLKSDGELFVTITAKTPIFDIYENMAREEKWAPYLTNVEDFISVYHHSDDPVTKLQNYLKQSGFHVRLSEAEDRTYEYQSVNDFWKFAKGINPVMKTIPREKVESYMEDYFEEGRKNKKLIFQVSGLEETVTFVHKILIACAYKSL